MITLFLYSYCNSRTSPSAKKKAFLLQKTPFSSLTACFHRTSCKTKRRTRIIHGIVLLFLYGLCRRYLLEILNQKDILVSMTVLIRTFHAYHLLNAQKAARFRTASLHHLMISFLILFPKRSRLFYRMTISPLTV